MKDSPVTEGAMKVLEVGHRSTAVRYLGRLLSDFGADVRFPEVDDHESSPKTGWDHFLDHDKVALPRVDDLWSPDVVITASRHSETGSVNHPYSAIPTDCLAAKETWRDALTLCITDFGQGAPQHVEPGGSAAVAALCGLVDATPGYPDTSSEQDLPVLSQAPLVDLASAIVASLCVHSLWRREDGTHVEISMLEAATAFMVHEWGITAYTGKAQGRRPGKPLLEPNVCLDTSNGRAVIAAITQSQWEKLVPFMDLEDEERFATLDDRRALVEELHDHVRATFSGGGAMELTRTLQAAGVPAGAFLQVSDALEMSQPPLVPITDEVEARRPRLPVSRVDQDDARAERLVQAGMTSQDEDLVGGDAAKPLAGVTVLDLGRMKAAPFTGMLLAALGAEVTVVETLRHSVTRQMGPHLHSDRSIDQSAAFNMVNRGKRSRWVDLRSDVGRRDFEGLVAEADVLIENFSEGGSRHLQVALPDLAAVNPRILLASIRGFGEEGPWRDWLALHSSVISLSGLGSLTKDDKGRPRLIGALYPDMLAGGLLATSIAAELGSGRGTARQVKINMFDLLMYGMGGPVVTATADTSVPVGNPVIGRVDRDDGGFALSGHQTAQSEGDGASVVPIRTMVDVFADPHLIESGFVDREQRDDLEGVPVPGVPWLIDGERPRITSAPHLAEERRGAD